MRLLALGAAGLPARVQLQRADADEGGVGREALVVRVEGRGEGGELGGGAGGEAEGAVCVCARRLSVEGWAGEGEGIWWWW